MLALSIPDVKAFMVKLLKEETFDDFQLRNAVVNTFARFEIYGVKDEACALWGAVRPHIFGIIKGGTPPKSIKIIFGKEVLPEGAQDATSLFINLHFEDGKINLTTGISKKGFSMDKTDSERWDAQVLEFLGNNNITYTNEI
ncbi:MAG: DUF5721 family protein [Defluviitaleaceae bacterium]|nr:DUF5721 family protein [Defluviitaleaceae bacterium]